MDSHISTDRLKLYRFRLDRILGSGGTGTVYRGIDTGKGDVVAIKRFRDNFFRNVLHKRDLKGSVRRFKKFNHPNVVRIFDFLDDNTDDGSCMVMEYVDGPSLKWYLEKRPWDLQERLAICAQLCNGLQYLHDQGVTHHDFKPANVLFTRKGQAKLCDYSLYGSSLLLELFDKGAGEQITPMFVAPEFLRREKPTNKIDQYALGVTMFMLFAGVVPFPADNVRRLYECHLRVTPEPPTFYNPKCPPELSAIILRLMAKKPEDRFYDCDQLRIALGEIGRSRI